VGAAAAAAGSPAWGIVVGATVYLHLLADAAWDNRRRAEYARQYRDLDA
jgi:hypothetical protein